MRHKGAVPRMMHPKQSNTSIFYTRNTGTNRLMKLTQLTNHNEVQTLIGSPVWIIPANHSRAIPHAATLFLYISFLLPNDIVMFNVHPSLQDVVQECCETDHFI